MKKIFVYLLFISFIPSLIGQTSKSINLITAGTLKNFFSTSEINSITNLTLSGNIDARDFVFMRDKLVKLSVVDISSTFIKEYNGIDGTYTANFSSYPANEIPIYAFYDPIFITYKSTLTSIKFPVSAVKIGSQAFYYCWNLAGTVAIPANLKTISDFAFYGCSSISAYSVDNSNTRYSSGNGVLFDKDQDTLFVFPPAKSGTYSIPNNVKHIGASAFDNCYYVTSITFPNSIRSIGSYAFYYCTGISGNLTLPTSLKTLEDGAFYGCTNITGTVTLPASLTELGSYCFLESNNISAFSVNAANPNYASSNAMLYSKNLDSLFICPPAKTGSLSIPESVKVIGSYAFYNCSKLSGTLIIPAKIDYIGYYAFYGCSLITSFQVNAQNNYFGAENGVLFSKDKTRLIVCPTSKTGTYQIPESVTDIDPSAFSGCINLSGNLYIPKNVKTIGDFAFYNCKLLSGFVVDVSNSKYASDNGVLLNYNRDTLLACPLAKSGTYTIPSTVNTINYNAFDACSYLTEIVIPNSVSSIEDYAFEHCTGLTKIHIPYSITSIGTAAFYSCTNLNEISIAKNQPPIVDYYCFELVNKTNCKLIVPISSSSLYSLANYWKDFSKLTEQSFYDAVNTPKSMQVFFQHSSNKVLLNGLAIGDNVKLYSLNAELLFSKIAISNSLEFTINKRGIFILNVNKESFKIIN